MNEAQARREYELIYVLRPQTTRAESEKVANRVGDVIKGNDGTLTCVENWGRRRLAFSVRKQRFGVYYYLRYLGGGVLVAELERAMRLSDDVMKFQTVKVSDDGAPREVPAEELQFEHVEPDLTIEEPSIAEGLGLLDMRRPYRDHDHDHDDMGDDGDEDGSSDSDLDEENSK